jgi:hypothetical protein
MGEITNTNQNQTQLAALFTAADSRAARVVAVEQSRSVEVGMAAGSGSMPGLARALATLAFSNKIFTPNR